jgi:hypothetical protein
MEARRVNQDRSDTTERIIREIATCGPTSSALPEASPVGEEGPGDKATEEVTTPAHKLDLTLLEILSDHQIDDERALQRLVNDAF